MLKLILPVLALASLSAFAESYDSLLNKQTTLLVTDVSKPDMAYGGSAESVCASIGYMRVVSFEAEPCTPGEAIYFRLFRDGAMGRLESNKAGDVVCGKMGYRSRITNVICAK